MSTCPHLLQPQSSKGRALLGAGARPLLRSQGLCPEAPPADIMRFPLSTGGSTSTHTTCSTSLQHLAPPRAEPAAVFPPARRPPGGASALRLTSAVGAEASRPLPWLMHACTGPWTAPDTQSHEAESPGSQTPLERSNTVSNTVWNFT